MYLLNGNIVLRKGEEEIDVTEYEKVLKENLTEFPELQRPHESILAFTHSNKAVIVAPDQITYALSGDVESIRISDVTDLLATINHILKLDDTASLILTFEMTTNIDGNSFEKSLELEEENATKLNAIGVGKRYIVDTGKIKGNVFIEPYLNDENKVYSRLELETLENTDKNEWNSIYTEMISYVNEIKGVINSIYN